MQLTATSGGRFSRQGTRAWRTREPPIYCKHIIQSTGLGLTHSQLSCNADYKTKARRKTEQNPFVVKKHPLLQGALHFRATASPAFFQPGTENRRIGNSINPLGPKKMFLKISNCPTLYLSNTSRYNLLVSMYQ